MRRFEHLAMLCIAATLFACDDDGAGAGGDQDGSVQADGGGGAGGGRDGGRPLDRGVDGDLPDGALPDGTLPDGTLPDGTLPDGTLPDGALPDGALPDGALPDGDVPECDEGAERPCTVPCAGAVETCVAGQWGACVAPPETCNQVDDDCDGRTDEDFGDVGAACSAGLGACAAEGVNVCTPDGNGVICNASTGMAGAETCDGTDEDCDGSIDEDLTRACVPEGGAQGACANGTQRCVNGEAGACVPDAQPSAEVCDNLDNDCDGVVDEAEGGVALNEACYGGPAGTEGLGICRGGVRTCSQGVLGTCEGQQLPGVDVCDGSDNDCNGVVDDNGDDCGCEPGAIQACYTGPAGTQGEGTCAGGTQTCGDDRIYGPCNDETLPREETCDGDDNDCDGDTDEAIAGTDVVCNVGVGACARAGTTFCDDEAQEVRCDVSAGAAAAEVCNNLDDDCDGNTDEGLGLGDACNVGQGVCLAAGRNVCAPDGSVRCNATAGAPSAELCNDLDDDCDGAADEGLNLGQACSVGVGACARDGALACDDRGQVLCNATAGAPSAEACDGIDNNCDGTIDEGNPGGGQDCNTGNSGICARGIRQCRNAGFACIQQAVPGAEVCDGLDNDCDGTVDMVGGATIDRACYGGPAGTEGVGLCRGGRSACQAGQFGACVGEVRPSPEVCDSADNNCNNVVDDIVGGSCVCVAGATRGCYAGPDGTAGVGACRSGQQTCNANGTGYGACQGQVLPGAEACDGIDNDCNARIDDLPGLGIACSAGVGACQAQGVIACNGATGVVACNAVPLPRQPEVCDRIDNDCDGEVDDVAGLGDRCSVGVGECRASGNQACDFNTQQLVCNGVPGDPQRESCNGQDDDCDGTVDEESPGAGRPCNRGVGSCQRAGRTVCSGEQGITCDAVPGAPSPELCDGADNDCNGTVDDNPTDANQPCTSGAGACAVAGQSQCAAGRLSCSGVALPPAPNDLCDAIDNDCDGQTDEGRDCTVYRSCAEAQQRAPNPVSGVYSISADGIIPPQNVYCDQVSDGGGWTLVASTSVTTLNDEASAWYADLTTLAPAGPHTGVWNGLRPLGTRFDVRFACRAAIAAENAPLDVDLAFYDVPWYSEMTTGTDEASCFSELNGQGADSPVPARRDLIGQRFRARGDAYTSGYLEGEDTCGDLGDFTVDLDARGMDVNAGDGTDWGEDDGQRTCGASGLATGQWFVFARERGRVAVVGLPPTTTTMLRNAGILAKTLAYDATLPGQMTTESFDTILIGRYAENWSRMTPAVKLALDVFGRNGGNVVAEWDGAAIFMATLDASFRYLAGATTPLGWFGGTIGGGASRGANTSITVTVPGDPALAGAPNPIRAGGATEFFFWLKNAGGMFIPNLLNMTTLATFPGAAAGFPDPTYGAIYRGRYCDGNAIYTTFDWSDDPNNAGFGSLIPSIVRSSFAAPPAGLADQCQNAGRQHVMRCGSSTYDVANFTGGLPVIEGCAPNANTQAMLVTRSGAVIFDAAVLRAYLIAGGIVIGEYSNSDELYNAVFGGGVVQPAQSLGSCADNVMPTVRFSGDDGFWQDNLFEATAANQTGCGFNLSAFPGIVPLGGWNAASVSLAYRNHGRGRLWLVETDWQDGQAKTAQTLGLMRYMVQHGAEGVRNAGLLQAGVQNGRTISSYLKSGFTPCHVGNYGEITDLAPIREACTGDVLVMACRATGSDVLQVSAMGRRSEVFEDVGDGNVTVNLHNGVNWYYSANRSWGFAPGGEAVSRNSCDTGNTLPAQRMCWHTNADRMTAGWRCGANTNVSNATYERIVLQRNGDLPN